MHKGLVVFGLLLIVAGVLTSLVSLRSLSIAQELTYENGAAYINGVYYGQLFYAGSEFDYQGWKIYASTAKQNIIGVKDSYAIPLAKYHGLSYIDELHSLIDEQEQEWEEEQQEPDGEELPDEPPANGEQPPVSPWTFPLIAVGIVFTIIGLAVKLDVKKKKR